MFAYRQVADRQIDGLTDKDTGIDRQTGGHRQAGEQIDRREYVTGRLRT